MSMVRQKAPKKYVCSNCSKEIKRGEYVWIEHKYSKNPKSFKARPSIKLCDECGIKYLMENRNIYQIIEQTRLYLITSGQPGLVKMLISRIGRSKDLINNPKTIRLCISLLEKAGCQIIFN